MSFLSNKITDKEVFLLRSFINIAANNEVNFMSTFETVAKYCFLLRYFFVPLNVRHRQRRIIVTRF